MRLNCRRFLERIQSLSINVVVINALLLLGESDAHTKAYAVYQLVIMVIMHIVSWFQSQRFSDQ